ncbi:sigma 54-interacting transcriptional regulator [Thermoanaerobacterium sp. DL9XJH110]|uniref:sigma 54-interacting transcriptional regulator n=1 Tax=Thermoanaerobacterium sp. DL9XJH110 TaxID=3386643 RepID=UPI003BB4EDF4
MARIGIVAPYRKLYYEALEIKEELNDDIDVRIGLLSNAVDVARDLIKNGAQVLISRGGTLNYIRRDIPDVPLVEIEISSYDIAEAIMEAKKISNHMALIIFSNMLYEKRDLSKLFNVDLKIFYIEREEQAVEAIRKAMIEGCEVMVGGGITNKVSLEMGIRSILISSGKDSVYRSIRQAQNILYYREDALKQTELIQTVMENTPLGIITTDRIGRIKMINSPALDILKLPREHVLGRDIRKIVPEIKDGQGADFIKEFGDSKIMVNIKPVDIVSSNIGSIITLEEISEISKKEKYIRSAFIKKGHVARYRFEDIIGESKVLKNVLEIAKKYAEFDSTVLIFGETGTGKEMFAQSIHNKSKRAKGPFVAVNCASLSESLLESELFGYVEGAFTGASKNGKVGLFEMAHKGTIFLDEISELPVSIQAKLLRVIQEKAVMRLGDDRIIPVDVRIIAASNKNLGEMVKRKEFREDLYYRLNVLTLTIPPLRERKQDIVNLFQYFIDLFCYKFKIDRPLIDKACLEIIQDYDWPGNVRELENFTERLLAAYGSQYIDTGKILELLNVEQNLLTDIQVFSKRSSRAGELDENEILDVLKRNNFNKTKTAKQLGIGRTTLWRFLKKRGGGNSETFR